MKLYKSGALAEPLADAVRYARGLGFTVNDQQANDASAFQQFVKEQMKNVFSQIKDIGGQMRVAEMKGLEQATQNPSLEPETNKALLGQSQGILDYANKYFNDAVAQDRATFDRARFTQNWLNSKENNLDKFIGDATSKIAVRGGTPKDPNNLVVGNCYVIEPNTRLNPSKYPSVLKFNGLNKDGVPTWSPVETYSNGTWNPVGQ